MGHSYIIVGSGVFGASTALRLIQKYPDADITLVDRNAFDAPTRVAASWDWNKVVRADYNDFEYTRLAWEARTLWKEDPDFKAFYHESGIYWIAATGFAQKVLDNFKQLGVNSGLQSIPVAEAKTLHAGLFDDADYTGIKEVLSNSNSGWAEAKEALQNVIAAAVGRGVKYMEAEVVALQFTDGEDGDCCGIKTRTGDVLKADRIILCTGAYTVKLLADSAPQRTSLHVGDRFIAAGVTEAIAPLTDEQFERFKDMPVAINEVPPEKGGSNGALPPLKDETRALKYWGQVIFRNTQLHEPTNQNFSAPPAASDYEQWRVPDALKEDVRFANKVIFGAKGEDLSLEKYRICWEALTPSEDFIISPHGSCERLYVATCGSFHGWKFFPVLGKYVLQMLDGELEDGLQNKWAWDRDIPSTEGNKLWPRWELRDMK